MAITNQSNILNLQPGITAPVVVHMSEGDSGTKLSFKLIDGANAWTDPGNVIAAVHGRRQDGTQFGPYTCSIMGDVLSFLSDHAMAGAAGSGIAEVVLTDSNGNTAGSANFAVMVERATFPMGVTYANDVSVYEAILAYAQETPAQITENLSAKIAMETAERKAADANLQSSINTEVTARETQDAVLSARMDEFAKLPDGSLSTAADAELVDIRVMANGETAETAGDAVRTQITEVKESISDLGKVLTQYISSDSAQGHYWRSTPTVVSADTTDAARKTYPSVELKAGTYYFSDIDASFTFVQNADTLAVTKINTLPGYDATEGKVAVDYSFILWVTSASGKQAMFADGVLPTEYQYGVYSVQYNGVDIAEMREEVTGLLSSAPVMRFVYVAPNGSDETGDGSELNPFATIYHANETITDNSELNQYTIKVADGTYTDLQARYAGTTPSSSDLQGVRCKPYVYYEGNINNPSACKILWDGAYGYDKTTYRYDNCGFYKCIFHVESGKTAIRGFTIEASNTRYAQHIECGGYGLGFEWEISDCVFIWHGTPDCIDRTSSPAAIGTGSGNYEKGHLLRCKIVNDSGITLGWMNHDSQNRYPNKAVYEGAEIVLESCVFNGGDLRTSVVWRNINGDNTIDGYDRFSVINCIGINSLTYMLSGQSTVCQWRGLIKCSDITNNDFATQGLLQ